ncbi:MAG TPA: hypothetical protein VII24_15145 [Pseudolabrys sp.]
MHASLFLLIISKVYRRQRRAFLSQIKSSQCGNAAAGFAFADRKKPAADFGHKPLRGIVISKIDQRKGRSVMNETGSRAAALCRPGRAA